MPKPDKTWRKVRDLRRFRRVRISVAGRYMLEDKREFECRTIDISAGGMALTGPVMPQPGERIVAYLEHLGRIDGTVVRVLSDGFAIAFQSTQKKRERLTDQLTWLINRGELAEPESRHDERIVPNNPCCTITLQDGTEVPGHLIDFSRSGAAVQCSPLPEMGSLVAIGHLRARVIRQFEGGVAVQFVRPIPVELFDSDYQM